jgi:hypothetical protein
MSRKADSYLMHQRRAVVGRRCTPAVEQFCFHKSREVSCPDWQVSRQQVLQAWSGPPGWAMSYIDSSEMRHSTALKSSSMPHTHMAQEPCTLPLGLYSHATTLPQKKKRGYRHAPDIMQQMHAYSNWPRSLALCISLSSSWRASS